MKINEVIQKVKKYHRGIAQGKPIDDATTRDQILYGIRIRNAQES